MGCLPRGTALRVIACFMSMQVMFGSCTSATGSGLRVKRQGLIGPSFNWSSITPSDQLQWSPCSDKFECARFEVPLDYADPSAGKGAIALMRSPSTLAKNDSRYQGPVLLNPGGPGISGILLLETSLDLFRTLLGNTFDIVGFDPRGVGDTTPFLTPFISGPEAAQFLLSMTPTLNHSADAFGTWIANAKAYGSLFAERTGHLAQYVSTPAMARDMLGIVKAHGFDKLQYLGISYGTILGTTFATMFPENVGKLVLDGVVDSTEYYKVGLDGSAIVDAEAVLDFLYESCVAAGPFACPLYETTADKIKRRVQTLLDKTHVNPVPVFIKGQQPALDSYGIVDYSLVKAAIFIAIYSPLGQGPALFTALGDLEKGNSTGMWIYTGMSAIQDVVIQPSVCPTPSLEHYTGTFVPGMAIACGDGDEITDSVDELRAQYSDLASKSAFAEDWTKRAYCSGWKIRAKERFKPSFDINTSYPILFASNTKDPVTPLHDAQKISGMFKNSALLVQNAFGHSVTANPTSCGQAAIRDYFQQGILPNASHICQSDNTNSTGGLTSRDRIPKFPLQPFPARTPFAV